MKIKMVDIARHLGVSKATVSLAVNGKPGVNEETRRMVLECLEEMKKNNEKNQQQAEKEEKRQWRIAIGIMAFCVAIIIITAYLQ